MQGKVAWFNARRGYGFITCEDKDYFAHYSQIQGDGFKKLVQDEEVEFEIGTAENGKEAALNIRPLGSPEDAA